MNWYYIPEEDDTYLYICPCPKKSKKGLTKSGKPYAQRWFCASVDWDGDLNFFIDMPSKYMREEYIRKPKKPNIYYSIIQWGIFESDENFSEFF